MRMALGASRGDVFREVLRQGLAIVLVGVTIGELLTGRSDRSVAGAMQEGIRPTGVSTHIVVGLVSIVGALRPATCRPRAPRGSIRSSPCGIKMELEVEILFLHVCPCARSRV